MVEHGNERAALIAAARDAHARGLAPGTAGNFSLRLPDRRGVALVTPSAVPYAALKPEDLPGVSIRDGIVVEAAANGRKPTSEVAMHLAIYEARADAHAIAHGHPVAATGLAAAHRAIPAFLDEVAAFLGGEVRVSTYAPSGTPDLARNVAEALGDRAAALIANHGAVAVGRNPSEAVEALALVEHAAAAYVASLAAGGPVHLPPDALARWRAYYEKAERRY